MTYILTTILIILNSWYSLKIKNSKLIAYLLIFFIGLLFIGNYSNPDYLHYSYLYSTNAQILNTIEIGFVTLIRIGNLLNLSYHSFLLMVGLLGFSLIHTTVKKYTTNLNLVYLLYFITPFFLDVIQIRNFLVMSILVFSFRYLIDEKKTKFLLSILFASLFHRIALAYLPFILVTFKDKNKIILRGLILVSSILSVVILINNKQIPYLSNVLRYFDMDKLYQYTITETNWGFLFFWGMQLLSILFLFVSNKIFSSFQDMNKDNTEAKIVNTILWLNNILIIYFPLYMINSNFFRISRNVLILNYIAFAITIKKFKTKDNRLIYFTCAFLYALVIFTIIIYPMRLYNPIFIYNLFL